MVMNGMKGMTSMKNIENKNNAITKLTPSKHLPKNKIKHEAIPKHLLSTKTTKRKSSNTVGDGLAKIKRGKTMRMDNVCKKPAASMTTPPNDSSGQSCVAKRYGLQDTMLSQYEKRIIKKKMDDAKIKREKGMSHDVPDEVLDEYMQLTSMQGNHGQQNAIDLLRKESRSQGASPRRSRT